MNLMLYTLVEHLVMMKYHNQTFYDHPRAYLSLESRMACGMGACYACVLKVPDSEQLVNVSVKDGPVNFKTGTVVYKESVMTTIDYKFSTWLRVKESYHSRIRLFWFWSRVC